MFDCCVTGLQKIFAVINKTRTYTMMIDESPQELLITIFSYLKVNNVYVCSLVNKQWCDMINNEETSCSQQVWKTLFQLTYPRINPHDEQLFTSWKQLYKQVNELKFVPAADLQCTIFENNNRTVTANYESWQTVELSETIHLEDYVDRPDTKFCYDIELDIFQTRKPTNFFSTIIGVCWNTSKQQKLKPEKALGYSSPNETGYCCGNRRVFRSANGYNFTGATGGSTFPSNENMLTNGVVVHVELTLRSKSFDIAYYVNGVLQKALDEFDETHLRNIQAVSILPCVSLINRKKLTVRKSLPIHHTRSI
jgi:hypothetical protein